MEFHLTATECHFHTGSHSVTCHPTQVNTPHLNPSHAGRYSIYLPRRDGRLSWRRWLVTYRDGLPARRRSPIQVQLYYSLRSNSTHMTVQRAQIDTNELELVSFSKVLLSTEALAVSVGLWFGLLDDWDWDWRTVDWTADITMLDWDGTALTAGLLLVVVVVADTQWVSVTTAGFVSCDIWHSITTTSAIDELYIS